MNQTLQAEEHQSAAGTGSLHGLGVLCGVSAGIWLGAAEAPTKLVNAGLSPFAISLCMVAGVFTARWTFPNAAQGNLVCLSRSHAAQASDRVGDPRRSSVGSRQYPNRLRHPRCWSRRLPFPCGTPIRSWGCSGAEILFRELDGADGRDHCTKVVSRHGVHHCGRDPARILYSSRWNEPPATTRLGGVTCCGWSQPDVGNDVCALSQGIPQRHESPFLRHGIYHRRTADHVHPCVDARRWTQLIRLSIWQTAANISFWLFLGGFVWVIGDLFQQFAAKYLGIGRGIPLSNTNQLWGLAWGALVFGELATADTKHKLLVLAWIVSYDPRSALFIATAKASAAEHSSRNEALERGVHPLWLVLPGCAAGSER